MADNRPYRVISDQQSSGGRGTAGSGSGNRLKVIGIGCIGFFAVCALVVIGAALIYNGGDDSNGDEQAPVEDVAENGEDSDESPEGSTEEGDGQNDAEEPTEDGDQGEDTESPEDAPTEEGEQDDSESDEPGETPEETATEEATPEPTEEEPVEASVPWSECYEPRPDENEHDLTLLPAEQRSLFQQCQIVAYYGFPGEPNMGIAGEFEPDEVVRRLNEQIAEYEDHNGFRTAKPALELIYAVAQGSQTADGTYLARMSNEMVEEYIDIAEEHDLMLIFDIQIGSSTVEAELEHLLPYLEHPRVHVALDPEFVTTPETPPGQSIGTLEASAINRAQEMVKEVVDEHDLPNKIVMVHQFIPEMIANKDQIENVEGIDLVIHQDGFGAPEDKIANYDRYVAAEGAKHGGFKVFYQQDEPVLTPAELMDLTPQPDLITYQ